MSYVLRQLSLWVGSFVDNLLLHARVMCTFLSHLQQSAARCLSPQRRQMGFLCCIQLTVGDAINCKPLAFISADSTARASSKALCKGRSDSASGVR